MPFQLPPLSSLRLFEAAGRHLSFKRAAEELNITPSAVSHGVVALEQALGVRLFLRETRKLKLTAEGADYLPYITEALSLIAIGTRRMPGRDGGRRVSVSCAPTMAARWLLPHLPEFLARYPGVSVSVETSHRQVAFPVDGFDFAIRSMRAPLADAAWTLLFRERLVPVCAPGCRDRLAADGSGPNLAEAPLIHVVSVSEDWAEWCAATGTHGLELEGGLRLDTIQLAFEAAKAGLGVAIGRRPLVDGDLADGSLVEAGPEAAATESAYWLVCAEGADRRPDLRAFKVWLLGLAGRPESP